VKFSNNHLAVAIGDPECDVVLYDIKTFKKIKSLKGSSYPIKSIDFEKSSKYL
jgi:hypothetical protein